MDSKVCWAITHERSSQSYMVLLLQGPFGETRGRSATCELDREHADCALARSETGALLNRKLRASRRFEKKKFQLENRKKKTTCFRTAASN